MATQNEMVSAGLQSHRAQAILGSFATGLTAAGNSQGTALALNAAVNVCGTVAASTGVILPALCRGSDKIVVRNGGANSLSVYPNVGGAINGASADAAFAVASGKTAEFTCVANDGLTWIALLSA